VVSGRFSSGANGNEFYGRGLMAAGTLYLPGSFAHYAAATTTLATESLAVVAVIVKGFGTSGIFSWS
jgi:hypothetical protein